MKKTISNRLITETNTFQNVSNDGEYMLYKLYIID